MNFAELALIGRIDGMPAAEYHAIDACSSSAIRGVLENAAKYRHKSLVGLSGDSIDFGSAVHAIACGKFDEECAVWAGRRDGRVTAYQEFLEQSAGKTIITPKQYDAACVAWESLSESVKSSPDANHILDGDQEVSLFWYEDVTTSTGEEVSLPCKCRFDVLNAERFFGTDIKTARDASPDGFSKAAKTKPWHIGYDVQAAWYLRGAVAVIGSGPWAFYFAAVENSEPYCAAPYWLDPDYIEDIASPLMLDGMRRFAECWSTNVWPGYDNRLSVIL